MIRTIKQKDQILGIIISKDFTKEGIDFFTPNSFSQQVGYMNRPTDYVIAPHIHNLVSREVLLTQEVLIIKRGNLRVDFYTNDKNYIESYIVNEGDIVLLANGGHGFKILEHAEIVEVKQGPYCGEQDKVRFEPIDDKIVIINK